MTASLIDTNVLVYANNRDSEFHAVCKSVVEKAINGEIEAVVAVQNLIRIIAPTSQSIDTLAKLIEKHSPRSQSIFDYLLVATMLDNGIHGIYTANSEHFKHFDSITVINPLSP